MGGVSQAEEQQIQRDVEIPPEKLPSDSPLLHGTATAAAENRLDDGVICKADHLQLLESQKSMILERGGCWHYSKGGNL